MTQFLFKKYAAALVAFGLVCTLLATPARAQSEASAALSMLPVASVVGAASLGAGAGASAAAAAVPVALSVAGAVLTVTAVQVSATGTVYVLERASDAAVVSVELVGAGLAGSAYAVGTVVTCGLISTGAVLSAAGEVLAFVPNALGRALLYSERL